MLEFLVIKGSHFNNYQKQKIMSKSNRNFNIFLVGFLILSLVGQWSFMMDKYASPFDYEGFQFLNIINFIIQPICILLIVYRMKYPKPPPKQLSYPAITSILLLLFLPVIILIIMYPQRDPEKQWKYFLPLKKINTTEISGTLKFGENFKEGRKTTIQLNEYPNISFKYPDERDLKSQPKMGDTELRLSPKDSVQLSVRSDIYNHIINNTTNRAMESRKYKDTYFVPYYRLTYKDSLIFEKMYLK